MKPCDCHDRYTAMTMLNEQGISFANITFSVLPSYVRLEVGPVRIKINQKHFERIAKWYLEDQEDSDAKLL